MFTCKYILFFIHIGPFLHHRGVIFRAHLKYVQCKNNNIQCTQFLVHCTMYNNNKKTNVHILTALIKV